jgi:hypothetical protein
MNDKLNPLTLARATGDMPQNVNCALHARMAEAFFATQHMAYTKAPSHAGTAGAEGLCKTPRGRR